MKKNITPEQIAQALGRVPAAEELRRIMAPKKKKKAKPFYIDFSDLFSSAEFKGWVDLTKSSLSTDDIVKGFFKVRNVVMQKPAEKDEVIFEKAKAYQAEEMIGQMIAGRLNDTNTRQITEASTSAIVNAINNQGR